MTSDRRSPRPVVGAFGRGAARIRESAALEAEARGRALAHPGTGVVCSDCCGSEISLVGRRDPITGLEPTVDLTPIDPERSCSRQHARIYPESRRLLSGGGHQHDQRHVLEREPAEHGRAGSDALGRPGAVRTGDAGVHRLAAAGTPVQPNEDGSSRGPLGAQSSVGELRGVGPARAEVLREAGIETVLDLLLRLPRAYEDRRGSTRGRRSCEPRAASR